MTLAATSHPLVRTLARRLVRHAAGSVCPTAIVLGLALGGCAAPSSSPLVRMMAEDSCATNADYAMSGSVYGTTKQNFDACRRGPSPARELVLSTRRIDAVD